MTVTFNFVGRGDSIMMLWESDTTQRLGVIDCNRYQGKNPTLDFIIDSDVKEIEFILLTHPHSDHFSGLKELIEHCNSKKIAIKQFIHTSTSIPDYLKASVNGPIDLKELAELWQLIDQSFLSGLIGDVGTISVNTPYTLSENWSMIFLAPTYHESRKVNHDLYSKDPVVQSKSYRTANYLSTLIMVYNTEKYFLLTSDVESSVFKRELSKNIHKYRKLNLALAQIPHHGAMLNYYHKFWRNLVYNIGTPTVASVGFNDLKHPSADVLTNLQGLDYDVKLTNGLSSKSPASLLGMISTPVASGSPLTYTF